MTSSQHAGKDICELIKDEHQNLFQILGNVKNCNKATTSKQEVQKQCFLFVKEASMHTANEEEVLYPLFKEKLAGKGKDFYDSSINEHTKLKKVLYDFDETDCNPEDAKFCERMKEIENLLTQHAKEEENVIFPELYKVMDKPTMVELGKKWIENKPNLPTRPHPDAPIGKVFDRALALKDWARDKIRFGAEMGQQHAVPQQQQHAMPQQVHPSK